MTAVIFIGPTISKTDALSVVDAICLPPAAQGDVYRALRHKPTHIGIIDGYFDGVAAVWHKEILWAMSQGIRVFGASSMGALRASELADFGMVGVGEIYKDFYDGRFEDDDEVAVIHGPAELGYPALCEPMVNIRATLEQAVSDDILTQENATAAVHLAKSMHYRHRTWKALIAKADLGAGFGVWLKDGKINQKHQDAMAMLGAVKASMDDGEANNEPGVAFEFEWTNQWVRATAQWDSEPDLEYLENNAVLDELRLLPDAYAIARNTAMLRYSAIVGPLNLEFEVSRKVIAGKVNSHRMERGLLSGAQYTQWLRDSELTAEAFERLLSEEVFVENSIDVSSPEFQHHLLGSLKVAGEFQSLSNRAKGKQKILDNSGYSNPDVSNTGLLKPVLLEWYFRRRLNTDTPDNIGLYAKNMGLTGREEFYRLLAREYLYLQDAERGKI